MVVPHEMPTSRIPHRGHPCSRKVGKVTMMRRAALWLSVLSLTLACTTLPPIKNPQFTESNLPSQWSVGGVQPVKQNYNGCVPACAEMVLKFYGKDVGKRAIADWIQRAYGTNPEDLIQFVGIHGFNAYRFSDWRQSKSRIKYYLSQGYPVLAGGKLGLQSGGHMIVLIGYDDRKKIVREGKEFEGVFYACDPSPGKIVEIRYEQFLEFHRGRDSYCIVIYPRN